MAAGQICAQNPESMPGMAHHHHDHAESPETLGKVSFPTSCAAGSRAGMERGVALLHSFGYTEAQQQFGAIAKSDPGCAMAHWGLAMTQYQELWSRPDAAQRKLGVEEMTEARSIGAEEKITPREKGYIDALSAFFDPADAEYQRRSDAYVAKMNALHAAYPDDVEAAAFDALALIASTPTGDPSLTHEHAALAILVPLFKAHPEHPGLAHYIIHTCDTPALAEEGLGAAKQYAKIAPSSPHALHMPAHIFARLGMWPEDINSNLASLAASDRAAAAGEPGSAHRMHAEEFLIYAYLQVGEDDKARVLTEQMRGVSEQMAAMPGMDDMKDMGPFFDNEVRAVYAAEMHDWHALAAQTPAPTSKRFEALFTYWGQGMAAGHLHDAKLAAKALADFDASFEDLKQTPFADYAPLLETKRGEMQAWKLFAEDHPAEAVERMRRTADEQDKLGQMEVDIPAREMVGDLLLLQHKPAEALREYKEALRLSPNRLNGLLSAGKAAEQAGQKDEAMRFYKAAVAQANQGVHSKRAALTYAVKLTGGEQAKTENAAGL